MSVSTDQKEMKVLAFELSRTQVPRINFQKPNEFILNFNAYAFESIFNEADIEMKVIRNHVYPFINNPWKFHDYAKRVLVREMFTDPALCYQVAMPFHPRYTICLSPQAEHDFLRNYGSFYRIHGIESQLVKRNQKALVHIQ